MNKHGLYDIYGGVHIPFWQTSLFWYAIVASIMLLCLIVWIFFRKKRKVATPIWTQALLEVEFLKSQKIATAQHGKEFYGKLTDIIKRYIQKRYCFESVGKTDEELIQYLQNQEFSKDLIELLQEIFLGITIVKFANAQAVQEQIDLDVQRTVLFIKRTIPVDKK